MIYIIGCGGVGSFLAPTLCMLSGKENITLVDGDNLETKNLNRQLFTEADIGKNKAEALAGKYGCHFVPSFYSESLMSHQDNDCLIGVVDNNLGRRSILTQADRFECLAIFGANEIHSSESYAYMAIWKDSPIDPRIMYPIIMTDHTGDPQAAAIGCTGEAQVRNVQLVTANFMAAALTAHMFTLWGIEAKKDAELIPHLPYKLVQNMTKNETYKVKDIKN